MIRHNIIKYRVVQTQLHNNKACYKQRKYEHAAIQQITVIQNSHINE